MQTHYKILQSNKVIQVDKVYAFKVCVAGPGGYKGDFSNMELLALGRNSQLCSSSLFLKI